MSITNVSELKSVVDINDRWNTDQKNSTTNQVSTPLEPNFHSYNLTMDTTLRKIHFGLFEPDGGGGGGGRPSVTGLPNPQEIFNAAVEASGGTRVDPNIQAVHDLLINLGYMKDIRGDEKSGYGMTMGVRTTSALNALRYDLGLDIPDRNQFVLEPELVDYLRDPYPFPASIFRPLLRQPAYPATPTLGTILGHPTSEPVVMFNGSVWQFFDNGRVVWNGEQIQAYDRSGNPLGNSISYDRVNTTANGNEYFLTQVGQTDFFATEGAPDGWNDCGPTSALISLARLGLIQRPSAEDAPDAIDAMRDAILGFDSTTSTTMSFMTLRDGLPDYGANGNILFTSEAAQSSENVRPYSSDVSLSAIDAAIARGNPVILGGYPKDAWGKDMHEDGNYLSGFSNGSFAHFVVVLGKTESGNYIVADPLSENGTIEVTTDQVTTFLSGSWYGAMEVAPR